MLPQQDHQSGPSVNVTCVVPALNDFIHLDLLRYFFSTFGTTLDY
jgi:hypothetical protein